MTNRPTDLDLNAPGLIGDELETRMLELERTEPEPSEVDE